MTKTKQMKGFATLSPEARRALASSGGKAVPPEMRVFSQNRTLAAEAGRKGGLAPRKTKSKDAYFIGATAETNS